MIQRSTAASRRVSGSRLCPLSLQLNMPRCYENITRARLTFSPWKSHPLITRRSLWSCGLRVRSIDVTSSVSQSRTGFGSADLRSTSPSLRAWLRECWAIIFSHPEDFVPCDFEMDRWLVVVRDAFSERGIQPLGLASRALDLDRSWVTRLNRNTCAVMPQDAVRQHSPAIDLQARSLCEDIASALPGQRLVLIIDGALRTHRTFTYSTRLGLPSPLDFLSWADALRARQATTAAPRLHTASETGSIDNTPLP